MNSQDQERMMNYLIFGGSEETKKQDELARMLEASNQAFVNRLNNEAVHTRVMEQQPQNITSIMDIHMANLIDRECDIYFKEIGANLKGLVLLAFDKESLLVGGNILLSEGSSHILYREFSICRSDIRAISEHIPMKAYYDHISRNANRYSF